MILVLIGNDFTFMSSIIKKLGLQFSLKDRENLYYFLGIIVIPTKINLLFPIQVYTDLLSRVHVDVAKDDDTLLSYYVP